MVYIDQVPCLWLDLGKAWNFSLQTVMMICPDLQLCWKHNWILLVPGCTFQLVSDEIFWRFCPSTPWSPWKSPNTNHKDWNENHLLVAEECWFGMIWRLPETYPQKNDGNTTLCPNLETISILSWRPLVLKGPGLHSWEISNRHSHSFSVLSFRHNMSHTRNGVLVTRECSYQWPATTSAPSDSVKIWSSLRIKTWAR